ncbi:UPF0262 family protein [Mesorhizobium sp.]|uniref:UPF0262 family protein n=1 Tax=Mesorhizobium sp. TaxID=1871066 RepID=UPI0025CF1C08|nr:UPF0262 family protein [Mesorhizobium sp.]
MDAAEFRFCDVLLEPSTLNYDGRVERERAIAVQDLVENSNFVPRGRDRGPFRLKIKGGFNPSTRDFDGHGSTRCEPKYIARSVSSDL